MQHAHEYRRCLLTGDVVGLMRIWQHTDPHLASLEPADAVIALHMARIEAQSIPAGLQAYSTAFLEERGYRKVDGVWIHGQPKPAEVVEAAGIASKSSDPRVAQRIVTAMGDAYLDALAAGIREPDAQRERMLKARSRQRFKLKID